MMFSTFTTCFLNDPLTTDFSTLSLHDALPISFISRNINTCYSSHRLNTPPYYLSLFLLMLRVVANNHYVPFTSDDLTLFSHWFNLFSYFHHFTSFYIGVLVFFYLFVMLLFVIF